MYKSNRSIWLILILGIFLVSCSNPRNIFLGKQDKFKPVVAETTSAGSFDLEDGPERLHRWADQRHVRDLESKSKSLLFYSGSHSEKNVALTFDDGPDDVFTPQILDILKEHNLKATFFIVGKRAEANPEMVKRILREGHAIGNHTWTHPDLPKLTPEQVRNQVNATENLLHSIIGFRPAIFRPPYGAATGNDVTIISEMGYKIIDWSVDTRDWAGTPTPEIMQYVRKELHPGAIILEHCAGGRGESLSNTVAALPEIITLLKSDGYVFRTIPELLNIPAMR